MGSDFSGCIVKIFYYIIPLYLIMKLIQKSPGKHVLTVLSKLMNYKLINLFE